jgi:hypothetical protein
MTKDELLVKVKAARPNKTEAACRAVASDLYYSGEYTDASSFERDDVVLDRLFLAYSEKAKFQKQKVAADDPALCPLCKRRLTPVKLDPDRKAVWCSTHFVVYPYKD